MVEGLPFDVDDDDFEFVEDTSVFDSDVDIDEEDLEAATLHTEALFDQGNVTINNLSALEEELKAACSADSERLVNDFEERAQEIKQEIVSAKTNESAIALKLAAQKEVQEIRKTIKEQSIQQIQHAVAAAESVDLAFCFDATDSMKSHITNVKKCMREIVRSVRQTNPDLKLRLGVVAYRDLDYSNPFDVLDFVDSMNEFENFLAEVLAGRTGYSTGTRDTPEDMAGGIQKVNLLSWQQPTKIVFLIADCPCHGQLYHSFPDNFPEGSPGIDIISELHHLRQLAGQGTMTLYFGKLSSRTNKMVKCFQQQGISPIVSPVNDATGNAMAVAVTKGIRSSIFDTVSVSVGNTAYAFNPVDFNADSLLRNSNSVLEKPQSRLKRFKVISKLPSVDEWENQPIVAVKVYKYQPIGSMGQLQKPGKELMMFRRIVPKIRGSKPSEEETLLSTMVLRRSAAPFAEGTSRIVFHGQIARTDDDLDDEQSNVILKSFKYFGKKPNALKQYLRQMEVSAVANFLAREYNRIRQPHCEELHFLKVFVVEEEADANEENGSRRYCAEEPLSGQARSFKKYSNNTGYWNRDEHHETLLRFTVFTYQATNGYLLVSDLQGIRKDSRFYLTDPVILCTDILRFGNSNLGNDFKTKCYHAALCHLKEGHCATPTTGAIF